MNTLLLEHGVCYGQSVTNREIKSENPGLDLSGLTIIAHVSTEFPQQVPSGSALQDPLQGLHQEWVLSAPPLFIHSFISHDR